MFETLEHLLYEYAFYAVCWFFSNFKLSKNSFWNTIRVSISLDTDQV